MPIINSMISNIVSIKTPDDLVPTSDYFDGDTDDIIAYVVYKDFQTGLEGDDLHFYDRHGNVLNSFEFEGNTVEAPFNCVMDAQESSACRWLIVIDKNNTEIQLSLINSEYNLCAYATPSGDALCYGPKNPKVGDQVFVNFVTRKNLIDNLDMPDSFDSSTTLDYYANDDTSTTELHAEGPITIEDIFYINGKMTIKLQDSNTSVLANVWQQQ